MALANLIQMQWSYTQGNWAAYIQQNSIHTWLDWNTIWQTNTLLTPHVSNHFAFFFSFFSINIKRKTENDFQFNAFNPPNVLCFPCIFYELIYEDEKKKTTKIVCSFSSFRSSMSNNCVALNTLIFYGIVYEWKKQMNDRPRAMG